MSNLLSCMSPLGNISKEASADLEEAFTEKKFAQNEQLISQGKICRSLFFIEKGIVKLFSFKSEEQFIMHFAAEGSFITVIDSYLLAKVSKYEIAALEKTVVKMISSNNMEMLCRKHHCLEHVFRNLITLASVNMMSRINEMLEDNTLTRYKNFLEQHPDILNRIKLGDLAAYLGVTKTTLSRIRAKRSY